MDGSASFVASVPTVRVNGAADPTMPTALQDVSVRQPAAGMASAELRLVNWGTRPQGGPGFLFDALRLGDAVDIAFGTAALKTVFTGEITAIEERYGEGAPLLVVLAEDRLHRLSRIRAARVFADRSPDDIARTIAGDAGLGADVNLSAAPGTTVQLNESDLAFLRRLCALHGAAPRVTGGTLICRRREPGAAPIRLDANDTVRHVRIMADLARQPRAATLAGVDLSSGQAITARSATPTVPAPGTTAATALAGVGWGGDEAFAHPAPASQAEADAWAAAAFDGAARRFLRGDIVCDGIPDIVVGATVALVGVSARVAGDYAVCAAAHLFDRARGYETYARLERAAVA